MKQGLFYIILFTMLCSSLSYGQVTIGSANIPSKGTLLDLKEKNDGTSQRGLSLPRVAILNRTLDGITYKNLSETIQGATGDWDANEHIGLLVYNTKNREDVHGACPGIYVWDGAEWLALAPSPIKVRDVPVGDIAETYTSLGDFTTPIDPTNEMWTSLNKNPSDYTIGANNIKMKDEDQNEYNSIRFYVGYVTRTGTYQKEVDISCNETSVWVPEGTPQAKTFNTILDGIWITQNVYSSQKAGGGAFSSGNYPRLNKPYLSQINGTLLIDITGIPVGSVPDYGLDPNENTSIQKTMQNVSYIDFAKEYGLAYTWGDAMEVCPSGWHVPTNTEWNALAIAHGGSEVAASNMRKNDKLYYTSADNVTFMWGRNSVNPTLSGFDAVPAGNVGSNGADSYNFGNSAYWWSASPSGNYTTITNNQSTITSGSSPLSYFPLRCVQD